MSETSRGGSLATIRFGWMTCIWYMSVTSEPSEPLESTVGSEDESAVTVAWSVVLVDSCVDSCGCTEVCKYCSPDDCLATGVSEDPTAVNVCRLGPCLVGSGLACG